MSYVLSWSIGPRYNGTLLYYNGTYCTVLLFVLTHWGWVMHICVDNLTIIGPDNGLSPGRRQAIICTNAGILLIGPLGTNFSKIQIRIQTFSYKKMHLKMSSVKWHPFCLGLRRKAFCVNRRKAFIVSSDLVLGLHKPNKVPLVTLHATCGWN